MANIRKTRQGKWQVSIRKKGNKSKYKSFILKSDAKKWARDIELKMDRMIFEDYNHLSKITLKKLIIKYRDEIVIHHKAKRQTSSKLNTLLKYEVSKLYLNQIQATEIFEFKKELKKNRKSPKTINIYISLLKSIWRSAQTEWGIALPSISPFIFIKHEKVNNQRSIILNDCELKLLLENCDKSKLYCLRDIVEFALFTGARINEILSLEKCNINLIEKIAILKNTKNGDDREIPLNSKVIEIIKKHPFSKKIFNVSYGQVYYYFDIVRKMSKISHFRFHDLRACFCTKALLSGMSVAEVSAISGHKDWSQLRRYTRIKAHNLINKIENIKIKI